MAGDIEFEIDVWTPDTIPQGRLGEYLIEVAKLYGQPESVHFKKLRKGSTILVSTVAETALPKVRERLRDIRLGKASKEAVDTFRKIDDMLAEDNAVGTIRGIQRGVVIAFPGRTRAKPIEYAAIREEGTLEGEIIRIGGRDKTVHLTLQSGDAIFGSIETDRDMARRLGPLIFGPTVRLYGMGSWRREADGAWSLDRFVVAGFDQIEERPLASAVDDIRSIKASMWGAEASPVAALLLSRHGKRSGK
jgi:hypothetical protein